MKWQREGKQDRNEGIGYFGMSGDLSLTLAPGICSSVLLFPRDFMLPLTEGTERAKPGQVTTS